MDVTSATGKGQLTGAARQLLDESPIVVIALANFNMEGTQQSIVAMMGNGTAKVRGSRSKHGIEAASRRREALRAIRNRSDSLTTLREGYIDGQRREHRSG